MLSSEPFGGEEESSYIASYSEHSYNPLMMMGDIKDSKNSHSEVHLQTEEEAADASFEFQEEADGPETRRK